MINAKELVSQNDLFTIINEYVGKSSGLLLSRTTEVEAVLSQKGDGKKIRLKLDELNDVLVRRDVEGREFLQVNMASGTKILVTDHLVGFKPIPVTDLDVAKLPKVVTTMDLFSVFEAIEEATTGNSTDDSDLLKRVFQSILLGAEAVGFDLSKEKLWLKRLPAITSKTAA